MGKALIIAEKPSVASDIAKALGKFTKQDAFFENEQFVISSAVGHLLQICVPEEFEVQRGKWSFAHLAVIPPRFDLLPIEKNESRLKVLVRLAGKPYDHVRGDADPGTGPPECSDLLQVHPGRISPVPQPQSAVGSRPHGQMDMFT